MPVTGQIYKKISLFVILSFLFINGCSTVVLKDIHNGKLSTEGCIIEAVDKSFRIIGGNEFSPSYQNPQFKKKQFGDGYTNEYIFKGVSLVNGSDIALRAGAKPVKVSTPYLDQQLYGILFLGMTIESDVTEPAAKSYLIKIPKGYVDAAMDGGISVIYELQELDKRISDRRDLPTWILWLSDQKFW